MKHTRLQVYTDEKLKRRINLAATKYNIPVTQYCLKAIVQQLQEDEILEQENITIPIHQSQTKAKLFDQIEEHVKQISDCRNGEYIDVDAIIDQMHEERDKELLGLC